MNDLEFDDESVVASLVSPFDHSDNDSDDGEVLNELTEYENFEMLHREKEINSFDRDDMAFQCMIGFRKFVAYFDPFLPINIITRKAYNTIMIEEVKSTRKNLVAIVRDVYVFVGSFTYITDFVVLKDIGEFILIDKAKVVMGKPFRKITKLEYVCAKGLITWMAFGGNTRELGSFREKTDEITYLYQILEEVLLKERADDVASIKQRRRGLFSDGVWNLETASGWKRECVERIPYGNSLRTTLPHMWLIPLKNANLPPTSNRPVPPAALRAQAVQELHVLQRISAFIDSHLESIEQFLNNFSNHPNDTNMNDLESYYESVDTPLVSPFPHSDNDSDDGEVLNELIEYESVGMLRRKKAINSFDRDDMAVITRYLIQTHEISKQPITTRTKYKNQRNENRRKKDTRN
uniref:MAK10-like protein n=1 Tax=Tanacetum cinerariifolium TaxID=118510 RepID=A0A6L2MGP3_TANCI|nr:hypothetical protein [Tanacetum cinerariifolium]